MFRACTEYFEGLRTDPPAGGSKCQSKVAQNLALYLREDESKPVLTIPPAVRAVEVHVEPTTSAVTVRVKQVRITSRIFDGLVHSNDPPQAHGFDVLIRELFSDETCHFGVGLSEASLGRFRSNCFRDSVTVLEEHAFEHSDLGCHIVGWLEVRGTQYAFSVIAHINAFAFQGRLGSVTMSSPFRSRSTPFSPPSLFQTA